MPSHDDYGGGRDDDDDDDDDDLYVGQNGLREK